MQRIHEALRRAADAFVENRWVQVVVLLGGLAATIGMVLGLSDPFGGGEDASEIEIAVVGDGPNSSDVEHDFVGARIIRTWSGDETSATQVWLQGDAFVHGVYVPRALSAELEPGQTAGISLEIPPGFSHMRLLSGQASLVDDPRPFPPTPLLYQYVMGNERFSQVIEDRTEVQGTTIDIDVRGTVLDIEVTNLDDAESVTAMIAVASISP